MALVFVVSHFGLIIASNIIFIYQLRIRRTPKQPRPKQLSKSQEKKRTGSREDRKPALQETAENSGKTEVAVGKPRRKVNEEYETDEIGIEEKTAVSPESQNTLTDFIYVGPYASIPTPFPNHMSIISVSGPEGMTKNETSAKVTKKEELDSKKKKPEFELGEVAGKDDRSKTRSVDEVAQEPSISETASCQKASGKEAPKQSGHEIAVLSSQSINTKNRNAGRQARYSGAQMSVKKAETEKMEKNEPRTQINGGGCERYSLCSGNFSNVFCVRVDGSCSFCAEREHF